MVLINLLPWRTLAMQERHTHLHKLASVVLGSILFILVLLHMLLQNWLDSLETQINELKAKTEAQQHAKDEINSLTAHDDVRRAVQRYQQATGELFHQLSSMGENNLCLTRLSRHQGRVSMQGKVPVAADIDRFLSQVHSQQIFNETVLEQLRRTSAKWLAFDIAGIERVQLQLPEIGHDQQQDLSQARPVS